MQIHNVLTDLASIVLKCSQFYEVTSYHFSARQVINNPLQHQGFVSNWGSDIYTRDQDVAKYHFLWSQDWGDSGQRLGTTGVLVLLPHDAISPTSVPK